MSDFHRWVVVQKVLPLVGEWGWRGQVSCILTDHSMYWYELIEIGYELAEAWGLDRGGRNCPSYCGDVRGEECNWKLPCVDCGIRVLVRVAEEWRAGDTLPGR